MSGRNRAFCSSVPWATMVGPASSRPSPLGGPAAPKAAISRLIWLASSRLTPLPYHSTGQVGAHQPAMPSRSHHSATVRSGSQFCSSQARSSSMMASSPVSLMGGSVGRSPLSRPTRAAPDPGGRGPRPAWRRAPPPAAPGVGPCGSTRDRCRGADRWRARRRRDPASRGCRA